MLKLVGATLIIGMTSLWGFRVAARYSRRPQELRALQTALAVLTTEVEYGATPMPEALRQSAQAAGQPVRRLLLDTVQRLESGGGITPGEALQDALASFGPESHLSAGDLTILQALTAVLGASDRRDQVRHLRLALERLIGAEAQASEERQRYERMYKYVGVLSGLALVLILY